jgi:non-heme chloroperoxidase
LPTFRASGCDLHYLDEGEGQPIAFIHGLWLTGRFFHKQITALNGRYRVVAPDLRGHGRSEKVLDGHTVPVQTADLHELIVGLDLGHELVLVGWSSGAFCVWEYVQRFATSGLKGVVIVNESPSDLKRPDWPYGMIEFPGLIRFVEMIETNFEGFVRERFVQNLFKEPCKPEEAAWMGDEILMTPPVIAAAVAFDELTRDYRSALADVDVPALVAWGRHDALPFENASYLAEHMPQARLVTFEHSGHAPFYEEPALFNAELDAFISSLD